MAGNGWSVEESEEFEHGAMQCGGMQSVDEVIAPIIYALHRNPLGFHSTGVSNVRIAKTKVRVNGPDIVLSHTVWFRADSATRTVELLWVEITKPIDMDWDDDWEIPF